jgi:hypothetical protein
MYSFVNKLLVLEFSFKWLMLNMLYALKSVANMAVIGEHHLPSIIFEQVW